MKLYFCFISKSNECLVMRFDPLLPLCYAFMSSLLCSSFTLSPTHFLPTLQKHMIWLKNTTIALHNLLTALSVTVWTQTHSLSQPNLYVIHPSLNLRMKCPFLLRQMLKRSKIKYHAVIPFSTITCK